MKVCTKCNQLKDDFPHAIRMADGLSSWCRECHRNRRREAYARDPEKYKAAAREYVSKNKKKVALGKSKYYKKHKLRLKAYKKEWRLKRLPIIQVQSSEYYRNNSEKIRARSALWRRNNKARSAESMKNRQLRVLYGVDRKWLRNTIKAQGGRCALCECTRPGGPGTWNVDHDHKDLIIRGLLCSRCNRGLGYFDDDAVIIKAAAMYLRVACTGLFSVGGKSGGNTRQARLKYSHGLTISQFDRLFSSQENRCAICKKANPVKVQSSIWKIDHDHRTLKIRGILCGKCNLGLGYFRDDAILLTKAIAYLSSKLKVCK